MTYLHSLDDLIDNILVHLLDDTLPPAKREELSAELAEYEWERTMFLQEQNDKRSYVKGWDTEL